MATTTPNYGWTVPTSGDLVKDGATAIETLGDAIDASMNTALGTKKAGMVLLNTTSFSGVSSVSLPANTFTSTYTNYKIIFQITAKSVSNYSNLRLRASGTDSTAASYDTETIAGGSTSAVATQDNSNTFFNISQGRDRSPNELWIIDILNPQATANTFISGLGYNTDAGTGQVTTAVGGRFETTTSFDSASFYPNTGTITGSYAAYAYGN